MDQLLRAIKACLIVFVIILLFLICMKLFGCATKERRYFEMKYPGCVVNVVEKTKIKTKAIVECPGREPEVVTIRKR